MAHKINFKALFKKIIFLVLFLALAPLYAQTSQTAVETATREPERFGSREQIEQELRSPPKTAEIKSAKPLVSAEEKEQKFFIKKIELIGCETFPCEDFLPLVEKYENKELSLDDLNTLARKIELEYLKRNVIAAVFVHLGEKEKEKQTAILQVVEARMGQLKIEKHKYFNAQRLRRYWKIEPNSGEILRYDKISRSIQMMNRNLDRKVKADLHAGEKPGTTDVTLTAKTGFPLHFAGSFDNEGTAATGKSRTTLGIRHNNFLGFDDTLLSGYSFGDNFNGIYGYHSLPVNYSGTSLLYGYSHSQSKPKKQYAADGIKSDFTNTSISLHQDLYKEDTYLGEVFLGFDADDKTVRLNTGPYYRDRLRIFNLGGAFFRRGTNSTTYSTFEYNQGVNGFGSSGENNPLASRGAKPVFSKVNLALWYKRALPRRFQVNLRFKTQLASRKLTPQQEFSLGGMDSVRGYPLSDYLADNAVTESLELLIPTSFIPRGWHLPYADRPLRDQVATLFFIDHGWGMRKGALVSEHSSVNFLSIGPGINIRLYNQANLRLAWGFPLAANHSITEKGDSRFHFSVDFQDKLPEEIERIQKMIEEENIKLWTIKLIDEELSKPNNPIREKLTTYLYLADQNYKQGDLKKAKKFYEKVRDMAVSLYEQARDYVRDCLQQQKELQEYRRLALGNYKEGNLSEAKELWQKIIDEAKPKSLVLQF